MKCAMACKNKAKLKVSTSGGTVQCLCFRCSYRFIKAQLKQLGKYDFGLYVQRVVDGPREPHVVAPEARRFVRTSAERGEDGWDF